MQEKAQPQPPQKHQKDHDVVKLRLVDLPGYGFSFTPKDQDGFQDLLLEYLLGRGKALKRVLLLLDGRHGMKKADVDFIETLQEQAFVVRLSLFVDYGLFLFICGSILTYLFDFILITNQCFYG